MHLNLDIPRGAFEDRLQLTNWILDSGARCNMAPNISYFVMGSLVKADKYIEVEDTDFVTEKKAGESQINIRNDNGKHFIATFYILLFVPDLCD